MTIIPVNINGANVFPKEISVKIFSYLEKQELATCCQVNSVWRKLASDNVFWRETAVGLLNERGFNGEVVNVPNYKLFAQELRSQSLRTNEEVLDSLQTFLNKVSLGQNGRFRCLISTGPKYQAISVEIKGSKGKIIPNTLSAGEHNLTDFDFKEDCIAVNGIGDGSLVTSRPPQYQLKSWNFCKAIHGMGERIVAYTAPAGGPFQAVLRFPELDNEGGPNYDTEMQDRITNMLQMKLGKLTDQSHRQNAIRYTTAAGVVLLSAYLLKKYLTPK